MNNLYLHPGQLRYKLVDARDSVNICSRRWGKSFIIAMRIMGNVLEMPADGNEMSTMLLAIVLTRD